MKVRMWMACALVALAAPLNGGERLTIRVSPAVAFEPANLVVRTRVERDEKNRSMEIIAESGTFYRSSEIPLDGERAPHTTRIEFRSLPGGEYHVTAVLRGAGGRELAMAQSRVNIMPMN